jgi:hypothetical protein
MPREPSAKRSREVPAKAIAVARWLYGSAYVAATVLFAICGVALLVFAAMELWSGLDPTLAQPLRARFGAVLEGLGLLTIAVAALELSQTVLEEEVQRDALMSAPTPGAARPVPLLAGGGRLAIRGVSGGRVRAESWRPRAATARVLGGRRCRAAAVVLPSCA